MKFDFYPNPLELEDSIKDLKEKLSIFLSTHPLPQGVIQALHNLGL
ncbi:hypothetical protein KBD33_04440 [Candidatus Gracilibacteria bacterium]|nr:hypothetical protein [Candidatus Gracilibacteria bacterium]